MAHRREAVLMRAPSSAGRAAVGSLCWGLGDPVASEGSLRLIPRLPRPEDLGRSEAQAEGLRRALVVLDTWRLAGRQAQMLGGLTHSVEGLGAPPDLLFGCRLGTDTGA